MPSQIVWRYYIIPDQKASNPENDIEIYDTFAAAQKRFDSLRGADSNHKFPDLDRAGRPNRRLTLGIRSADGMLSADVVYMSQGSVYAADDFAKLNLKDDSRLIDIVLQITGRMQCNHFPAGPYDHKIYFGCRNRNA